MKSAFRKYLSLFILGVFLFAYSEKGIHDLLHADDVHCHVLYENHFHTVEHHCAICDFEFPWFDKSVKPLQVSFLRHYSKSVFISLPSSLPIKEVSAVSSRGPPTLV